MIKNLIKQLTPPIVWNTLRKQMVTSPPTVTYEGQFKSFEEVPKVTNYYHSEISQNPEYEQALSKLRSYESGETPNATLNLIRLNFLPTLLAIAPDNITSILDVGGGMGTSYIDLLFSLQQKRYTMTVVELPAIAEMGRDLLQSYKDIQFTENFPVKGAHFDLVNFCGALQYFENYREVIETVIGYNPRVISISYTAMGPAETFVAAQVNMIGRVIPRIVFNIDEIVKLLDGNGYVIVHKSINYTERVDFSNYPDPIRQTRHWNLVFRAA